MICEGSYRNKIIIYKYNYKDKIYIKMFRYKDNLTDYARRSDTLYRVHGLHNMISCNTHSWKRKKQC